MALVTVAPRYLNILLDTGLVSAKVQPSITQTTGGDGTQHLEKCSMLPSRNSIARPRDCLPTAGEDMG